MRKIVFVVAALLAGCATGPTRTTTPTATTLPSPITINVESVGDGIFHLGQMELHRNDFPSLLQEVGADQPVVVNADDFVIAVQTKKDLQHAGFKYVTIAH